MPKHSGQKWAVVVLTASRGAPRFPLTPFTLRPHPHLSTPQAHPSKQFPVLGWLWEPPSRNPWPWAARAPRFPGVTWPPRRQQLHPPPKLTEGNGHMKSNGDYPRKDEGDPTPKKGTEEAAGATGDAIEPAPPRQGAENRGGRGTPMETTKKRKDFSFKKPFKLSGLSSREIGRRVGVICLPPHPQRQSRNRGRWFPAARKALPRKGRLLPLLRAGSTRPKGQRPALPPRKETQKKPGLRSQNHPLSRGQRVALHQQASRMSSWVMAGGCSLSCRNLVLVSSLPRPGASAAFLYPERNRSVAR